MARVRTIDVSWNKKAFQDFLTSQGLTFTAEDGHWTRYIVLCNDAQAYEINRFVNKNC